MTPVKYRTTQRVQLLQQSSPGLVLGTIESDEVIIYILNNRAQRLASIGDGKPENL